MRRDRKKNQFKSTSVSNVGINENLNAIDGLDHDMELTETLDMSADLLINREPISQEIISLRQTVLHPTGLVEKVIYKNDENASSAHFVIRKQNEPVAVGTVLPQDETEALSFKAWRIRGMSVHSEFQGLGLGTLLLDEILEYVKNFKDSDGKMISEKPQLVWCNARVEALNLYTRAGFEILGEEFIIPGSGPHKRLHLKL